MDYKTLGMKETSLLEINRHKNKRALQHEAKLRGIPPDKMLKFQKILKKEQEDAAYKLKFKAMNQPKSISISSIR